MKKILETIEWVSVKDEMPDDDQLVLICDTKEDVHLGWHDGDDGWRYESSEKVVDPVTDWAHVPGGPRRVEGPTETALSPATVAAPHEWRWHATGAGSGWNCWKCDGHYRFTCDEDKPPARGCPETGSPYWKPPTNGGGNASTGYAASRSETSLPSPISKPNANMEAPPRKTPNQEQG